MMNRDRSSFPQYLLEQLAYPDQFPVDLASAHCCCFFLRGFVRLDGRGFLAPDEAHEERPQRIKLLDPVHPDLSPGLLA